MRNSTFGVLSSVPGLMVLLAFIGYPVFYNLYLSFIAYKYVPMGFIGLINYRQVLFSQDFAIGWKVSAIYSLGASGLAFTVSVVLAEALRRIKRFRVFFRTLIILPWAVPLILSGIIFKWIFDGQIGIMNYMLRSLGLISHNIGFLYNSAWAMVVAIVGTAYVYVPFMTILIHAGMTNISQELYEAAEIDGADEIHKFIHITFPLSKIQMLVGLLIVWMFTFRTPDLIVSLTNGGPGKAMLHAGLLLMRTIYFYLNFGHGAAISVLLFITVLVVVGPMLYFIFMRKERGQ